MIIAIQLLNIIEMLETDQKTKFENIDDIIIGSGAGGFTAAAALAQAGHKVLVIEQHTIPGGWSQTYRFAGHDFSPGLHDVPQLGPSGRLKQIYEGLGLGQYLTWYEMNPDGYDHILIGDERFDVPSGKQKIIERLSNEFPSERKRLIKYFNICEKIWLQSEKVADVNNLSSLLKAIIKTPLPLFWSVRTGEQFVNHFIKNPKLKALLLGQSAGHFAMPPSEFSGVLHAAAIGHYLDGAWHPKGGGRSVVKASIKVIRDNGGDILTGNKVEKILLENKKAIGVRLKNGKEIYSKNLISNADPTVTFTKLVGKENISARLNRKIEKTKYTLSGICLTIVTDKKLDISNLDSGNIWYYSSADVEGIFNKLKENHNNSISEIPFLCLTTNSFRDPEPNKKSYAFEVFTFLRYDLFSKWENSQFGERPLDYDSFKQKLTDLILETINKIIPSFSNHILQTELATPLTNVHYTLGTKGNVYGTEKRRSQIGPWGYAIDTEIDNLKLCGSSTFAHGIPGASISGLMAAASVMNCKADDLLNNFSGEITYFSAEKERKKLME
jgi:all-trans-retinol 13,14-reductase